MLRPSHWFRVLLIAASASLAFSCGENGEVRVRGVHALTLIEDDLATPSAPRRVVGLVQCVPLESVPVAPNEWATDPHDWIGSSLAATVTLPNSVGTGERPLDVPDSPDLGICWVLPERMALSAFLGIVGNLAPRAPPEHFVLARNADTNTRWYRLPRLHPGGPVNCKVEWHGVAQSLPAVFAVRRGGLAYVIEPVEARDEVEEGVPEEAQRALGSPVSPREFIDVISRSLQCDHSDVVPRIALVMPAEMKAVDWMPFLVSLRAATEVYVVLAAR